MILILHFSIKFSLIIRLIFIFILLSRFFIIRYINIFFNRSSFLILHISFYNWLLLDYFLILNRRRWNMNLSWWGFRKITMRILWRKKSILTNILSHKNWISWRNNNLRIFWWLILKSMTKHRSLGICWNEMNRWIVSISWNLLTWWLISYIIHILWNLLRILNFIWKFRVILSEL